MSKETVKPVKSIRLTDEQFAAILAGKYGWKIDHAVKRSSLQHVEKNKNAASLDMLKAPTIHITKVLRPLYLKLIYKNYQINQLIQAKQEALSVSLAMQTSVADDEKHTTVKFNTTNILEKVQQIELQRKQTKALKLIKQQVEQRSILPSPAEEKVKVEKPKELKAEEVDKRAKLIRRSLVQQAADGQQENIHIREQDQLLTIRSSAQMQHVPSQNKESQHISVKKAKATMLLSQYIQRTIAQQLEQEKVPLRTKAKLITQQLKQVEAIEQQQLGESSFEQKQLPNDRVKLENQSSSKATQVEPAKPIAQVSSLDAIQINNIRERELVSNITYRSKIAGQLKYFIRTSIGHINRIRQLQQQNIENEQTIVFIQRKQLSEAAITEKARLVYRTNKSESNQHLYNKFVSEQAISESVQRENNSRTLQEQQILKSRLQDKLQRQIDTPTTETLQQHIAPIKQRAIVMQQSTVEQRRHLIVSKAQVTLVTKLHQHLLERHIRLIHTVEMVQKKKTPRSKKLVSMPEVKLIYRSSDGESISAKPKDGLHTVLSRINTLASIEQQLLKPKQANNLAIEKKLEQALDNEKDKTKENKAVAATTRVITKELRRKAQIHYFQPSQHVVESRNDSTLLERSAENKRSTQHHDNTTLIKTAAQQQKENKAKQSQPLNKQKSNAQEKQADSQLNEKLATTTMQTVVNKVGYKMVQNIQFTQMRKLHEQNQQIVTAIDSLAKRPSSKVQLQLKALKTIAKPQLQVLQLLHRRLQHIQAKAVILPKQAILSSTMQHKQHETEENSNTGNLIQQQVTLSKKNTLTKKITKQERVSSQQSEQSHMLRAAKVISAKQLIYRKENQSVQLQLLIEQIQQGQKAHIESQQQGMKASHIKALQTDRQNQQKLSLQHTHFNSNQQKEAKRAVIHHLRKQYTEQIEQVNQHQQQQLQLIEQTVKNNQSNTKLISKNQQLKMLSLVNNKTHLSAAKNHVTTTMNLVRKPASQSSYQLLTNQKSQHIQLHAKQLAGSKAFINTKHMTSKLNFVEREQFAPLNVNIVKNEQLEQVLTVGHKSKLDTQVTAFNRPKPSIKSASPAPVPLHVVTEAGNTSSEKLGAQQTIVKQLEMTVKRLEQELTDAKQMNRQAPLNLTQLTDQLYEKLTKKIRIEQNRIGR